MVLKDWKCLTHDAIFECTHGICPEMGCDSENVQQVHLKAPGVKSAHTKFVDHHQNKFGDKYKLNSVTGSEEMGVRSKKGDAPGSSFWAKKDQAEGFIANATSRDSGVFESIQDQFKGRKVPMNVVGVGSK